MVVPVLCSRQNVKFVLAGENSVKVTSLRDILEALEVGERSKRTVSEHDHVVRRPGPPLSF